MQVGGQTQHVRGRWVKKALFIAAGVIFAGAIAVATFFFLQYNAIKSDPNTISQEKTQRLKEKVSKLYAIPDETPTVAEISDKDKLKDQVFFEKAENGDNLFIFSKARLAILYREETNKLINVGPISITPEETDQQKSQQP